MNSYNTEREHQAIGDVAPHTRFELRAQTKFEVVDGSLPVAPAVPRNVVGRRVDQKGRISILNHRYHVGRHLAGQSVSVESKDGLLHVTHHDLVVATHARRPRIGNQYKRQLVGVRLVGDTVQIT